MASTYKNISINDVATTKTLLHEQVILTGTDGENTVMSGTYKVGTYQAIVETNVKNFSHGMWQSVYDYAYLSSSANHLLDVVYCHPLTASNGNPFLSGNINGSVVGTQPQRAVKGRVYNSLCAQLNGVDPTTKAVKHFEDPIDPTEKLESVFVLNLSRLITKDEVKKGTFGLTFFSGSEISSSWGATTMADSAPNKGAGNFVVDDAHAAGASGVFYSSPLAGEYSYLKINGSSERCGLIFYQAGVAVLTSSIFGRQNITPAHAAATNYTNGVDTSYQAAIEGGTLISASGGGDGTGTPHPGLGFQTVTGFGATHFISSSAGLFRTLCNKITLQNTTEINSTVYFCRINHSDFNYSQNRTYLTGSRLRVKSQASDMPVTYITTVGLYSADNELLAVAKLSEPLRKDPTTDMTIRVRLDY